MRIRISETKGFFEGISMPKSINEITIFVSSPNDVAEERESLEDIIKDINIVWDKQGVGIRFNLVRWETHTYPDIGTDAQAVINDQIDDYDIFIGIMWKRFGTPTSRSGSGTAEEFETAYKKFLKNPDKIKVMFYFNDAPIPPREIDTRQLDLINQFREELGEKGELYWFYNGSENFSQLVKTHLNLQLTHWQKVIKNENNGSQQTIKSGEKAIYTVEEDEEGFFELMEIGEKKTIELERIGQTITDISNTFQGEIESITSNNPKIPTPNEVKKAANQMAKVMDKFASSLEGEMADFSEVIIKAIDAYSRATIIATDFSTDKEELIKVLVNVQGAKNGFISTVGDINKFKKQLLEFPRITKPFNRSKKHTLDVLNSFTSEITNATTMMEDVEKSILEILSDLDNDDY